MPEGAARGQGLRILIAVILNSKSFLETRVGGGGVGGGGSGGGIIL